MSQKSNICRRDSKAVISFRSMYLISTLSLSHMKLFGVVGQKWSKMSRFIPLFWFLFLPRLYIHVFLITYVPKPKGDLGQFLSICSYYLSFSRSRKAFLTNKQPFLSSFLLLMMNRY